MRDFLLSVKLYLKENSPTLQFVVGNLRIIKRENKVLHLANVDSEPSGDHYVTRFVKLIPSEVLALYLIGENLIPREKTKVLVTFSIICFLLVFVSRFKLTQEEGGKNKPQWGSIIISSVSFVIWVYASGGLFENLGIYEPWLGTLLLTTWLFTVPYFYRGDKQ